MNTYTAPRTVCHLNPCQIDAYCDQPASHYVVVLEPGLNMPTADLMGCEFHAAEMVTNGEAEFIGPLAPYPDMGSDSDAF